MPEVQNLIVEAMWYPDPCLPAFRPVPQRYDHPSLYALAMGLAKVYKTLEFLDPAFRDKKLDGLMRNIAFALNHLDQITVTGAKMTKLLNMTDGAVTCLENSKRTIHSPVLQDLRQYLIVLRKRYFTEYLRNPLPEGGRTT